MTDFRQSLPPTLSIVVPVFNETANLRPLLTRTRAALQELDTTCEFVFVDDGSTDDTPQQLSSIAAEDSHVRLVRLSRNFGHQAALVAGLSHARGDAVITMDGDLQHPPELIPLFVAAWRQGADIVQAIRRAPADESPVKRTGSRLFYRLLTAVTRVPVTPGAADFRLMTRETVNAFLACGERVRFNRGLVRWIGFDCREIPYDAEPRHAGRSKYSWRAMFRLAGDAIFSFSSLPLRLAGFAGACVSLVGGAYLLFVLWAYFFTNWVQPGWSSLLATTLILGGVNLIVLWILGEYVGRLYEEAKQRPTFIVRGDAQRSRFRNADTADAPSTQQHTEETRSV